MSHNKIKKIQGLKKLVTLQKLSISHNCIRELAGLESNVGLAQLRLNDNKILRIPETVRANSQLDILDLGNNRIGGKEYIKALESLPRLKQVNLKGNPMKEEEQEIVDYVRDICEKILVVNNRRVVPKRGRKRHKAQPNTNPEEEKEAPIRSEIETVTHNQPKHLKKDKKVDKPKPKKEKGVKQIDTGEEKPEDVLVVSDKGGNKVKAGSEAKTSGIVKVESKKNLKRKKVKEKLLEQQQIIEKWN